MKNLTLKTWKPAITTLAMALITVSAQTIAQDASKSAAAGVKVTPETYIRAETDRAFLGGAMQAGGMNRFDLTCPSSSYHFLC